MNIHPLTKLNKVIHVEWVYIYIYIVCRYLVWRIIVSIQFHASVIVHDWWRSVFHAVNPVLHQEGHTV